MKKLQLIFLAIFLAACSSARSVLATVTPGIAQIPTLLPTQTTILPTQTVNPTSTLMPTITSTAIGGGGGKIAFVSERDGSQEIYTMNSDGSHQIALTNSVTPKSNPAWSPDGKKIAFGSNNNDSAAIYIMNAEGANPTKLIDTKEFSPYDQAPRGWRFAAGCCSPVWSPDGRKIAFRIVHYVGCCLLYSNIYIINADGSNLISVADHSALDGGPAWSPDSQKIAFDSGVEWDKVGTANNSCGGSGGICVMNADGTNLINLTRNNSGGGPTWSPDSKKIAFSAGWGGDAKIYVMNADGTDPVSLTHYRSPWENGPVWSPDGKKIAFNSYRDGNYEIYVMNADGTDLVNLTNNPADDGSQAWSLDSKKIAFVSGSDSKAEIYVMDADGRNLLRLTNNNANDYSPVWSP